MNIKKERNAFESWYQSIRGFGSLERWGEGYAYSLANNAWIAWQERASQPVWISVDDELPKLEPCSHSIDSVWSDQFFLIDEHGTQYVGHYLISPRFNGWSIYNDDGEAGRITHWMPIPAIPE